MNLNVSGIYKITNKINNKCYIGSAINIRKRWKIHRAALKRNKHHNIHLLYAFTKYGLNNFKFEVVETVENPNYLIEREQFWMDFYKCYIRDFGYNLSPTAGSPLGTKHSFESRKNMSLAHIGHKRSKEAHDKIIKSQYIKVKQINILTNEEKIFNSMKEAEQLTGVQRQLISMCCRKVTKTAKGYFWHYAHEEFIKPSLKRKTRKLKRIKNLETNQIWRSMGAARQDLKITLSQLVKKIESGEFVYV